MRTWSWLPIRLRISIGMFTIQVSTEFNFSYFFLLAPLEGLLSLWAGLSKIHPCPETRPSEPIWQDSRIASGFRLHSSLGCCMNRFEDTVESRHCKHVAIFTRFRMAHSYTHRQSRV